MVSSITNQTILLKARNGHTIPIDRLIREKLQFHRTVQIAIDAAYTNLASRNEFYQGSIDFAFAVNKLICQGIWSFTYDNRSQQVFYVQHNGRPNNRILKGKLWNEDDIQSTAAVVNHVFNPRIAQFVRAAPANNYHQLPTPPLSPADLDIRCETASEAAAGEYCFITKLPDFHRSEFQQWEDSERRMRAIGFLEARREVDIARYEQQRCADRLQHCRRQVLRYNKAAELDIPNYVRWSRAENEASRRRLEEEDRRIEEEFRGRGNEEIEAFDAMIQEARRADEE